MKIINGIISEACRTILRSSNRELRQAFSRNDAILLHKAARRVGRVWPKKKERDVQDKAL